jgi:VanZ family protein
MLYTNLGRIVAVLVLALGVLQIIIWAGFVFGGNTPDQLASALRYYFPGSQSWGSVFDRGVYAVLFAIALGILTEISRSVRANKATSLANETPSLAPQ